MPKAIVVMRRIERGEVSITIEKLYRIAATLQCEPITLLPKISSIAYPPPRKGNKS